MVTFRLCGWCMLVVFLLPAFTSLGHECQDLLSLCDGMHVWHRLDLGLYSHPEEFLGNGVRTHVNSKGKIPLPEKLLRGGWNPQHCFKQDSQPNTLPTELFWLPLLSVQTRLYLSWLCSNSESRTLCWSVS